MVLPPRREHINSPKRGGSIPLGQLDAGCGSGERTFILARRAGSVTGIDLSPTVLRVAAAIKELLRDPAKREQLGSAARQFVENEFSAERMTADYLRVYEDAFAAAAKDRERWVRFSVAARGKTK